MSTEPKTSDFSIPAIVKKGAFGFGSQGGPDEGSLINVRECAHDKGRYESQDDRESSPFIWFSDELILNPTLLDIAQVRGELNGFPQAPATPAPESPAPARTDLDWDLIDRVSKAPAQSFLAPEVGTGSEASPDAGASRREAESLVDAFAVAMQEWVKAMQLPDPKSSHTIMATLNAGQALNDARTNLLLSLLAKPAEASDAEQIPHPVAEAEQSSQPADQPEWTRAKPTEADYYWVRIRSGDPKGKGNTDLGIRLVVPEEWNHPLGGTWYEFNGPIPEPLAQAPTRTGG